MSEFWRSGKGVNVDWLNGAVGTGESSAVPFVPVRGNSSSVAFPSVGNLFGGIPAPETVEI